ncbi:hypothetical protein FTUN_0742 [Frigoriglobus tundricola]|uniref:Uncharacterized protein n=1 Tax=Frigoriglobus tundricola TaxID=2774151 RepID=A0A6M5YGR9_9BACT|nr:hypothetical protein FTUN_0742 [Frigoriglobus tundricola]
MSTDARLTGLLGDDPNIGKPEPGPRIVGAAHVTKRSSYG